MLLGILSDTHNQTKNLQKAITLFKENRVDTLIHCGDMTTVETAQFLCEFRIIYVFGNGDFVSGEIRSTFKAYNQENYGGISYTGEIHGKKIGVMHGHLYPQLNEMINSGQYDYVFTGHTHRRKNSLVGKTRVINPGALGGTKYQTRSAAILDLAKNDLFFKEIE